MLYSYPTKNLSILVLFLLFNSGVLFAQEFKKINTGAVVKHSKVSFDGSKMVFLANYYGSFKPYITQFNADSMAWDQPVQFFTGDAIAGFEIRYPQLSFDNKKLYFSAKTQEKADFDIYYSELKAGEWSKPIPLEVGINSPLDELDVAVSADEKKILFTRPLPAEAKADDFCGQLFFTELTEAGSWSEPELLPPAYNTGCICSPYYTRDNKTFFYSSYEDVDDAEGKKLSRKQFNVFWAKIDGLFRYNPKPFVEIITDDDLVSPSIDMDSTLYYNVGQYDKGEDRIESIMASRDLSKSFQPVQMTLISGIVTDENQQSLIASVQAINPYTTKVFQEVISDENGYYQLFVPQGEQYSLLASKEQYSSQSKLLQTDGQSIESDFELFPSVAVTFNVFDTEFYFPIESSLSLYDSEFNFLNDLQVSGGEQTEISLGKELNIIISSENYFPDTLNLPFDEEVIFDSFDFDIELQRKLKDVSLSFADESGNNLGLEITVYNVTRNEKTKRVVKDGKVLLQLRDGEVYEISTSAEGYSYYSAELDLTEEEEILPEVTATLKSVENVSLVLDNITFEYNSYELNAESYVELGKLVTYLAENEQYRVEVSAHTDSSGPDDYNLKLSNLRANSVLQHLQDNSINKDRLVAVGYGESQPIFPNDTEANMAKNRRVEFKILTDNE